MRKITGKLSYQRNGMNHIEHNSFKILDPDEVAVNRKDLISIITDPYLSYSRKDSYISLKTSIEEAGE